MNSYQIQGCTHTCSQTGRTLVAGEKYYSVLFDEAGSFYRKDFSLEAWAGSPSSAVGFWMSRVPSGKKEKKLTINDELLWDCFAHLQDTPDKPLAADRISFRYVLTLLLMRRKRLKFEDIRRESGSEWLCVKDSKSNNRYEILDPRLPESAIASVQEEVFKVLGWE